VIRGRSATRRFSRALGPALLLALLAGGQTASAGLHPTEARYHLDFARLAPEAEPPVDGADGDMPPPPHPEASLIERRWYTDEGLADASDPNALEGLARDERVLLVDTDIDGVRFSWQQDFDYSTGEISCRLQVWRGAEKTFDVQLRLETELPGRTKKEFIEGADDLPGDRDVYLDIDLGGRLWSMPLDRWQAGDLVPEDRLALEDALDEGNLRELEMVAGITRVFVEGVAACRWVAAPLLGEDFEDLCISEHPRLVKILAKIMGADADCSFDATFGEPCFDHSPQANPPTNPFP
jgi:hypothetical protein